MKRNTSVARVTEAAAGLERIKHLAEQLALAPVNTQVLRETWANLVASTLLETRTYLGGLVEIPRIPVPETTGVHAA